MHYDALRQPLDPTAFIADLQDRLRRRAERPRRRRSRDGSAGGVRITNRRGEPWITVPRSEAQAEPQKLEALKEEVERRWGTSTCWICSRRPTC